MKKYAVIFTRNDGFSGITTIEAIKDTYEDAVEFATDAFKKLLKKSKYKFTLEKGIERGDVEYSHDDFFDKRIKDSWVYLKLEYLIQEIEL